MAFTQLVAGLLIALLSHNNYSVRELATNYIIILSPITYPILDTNQIDPEVNRRIAIIIDTIESTDYTGTDTLLRQYKKVPYLDSLLDIRPDLIDNVTYNMYKRQAALLGHQYTAPGINNNSEYPADRFATRLWLRDNIKNIGVSEVKKLLPIMEMRSTCFDSCGRWTNP